MSKCKCELFKPAILSTIDELQKKTAALILDGDLTFDQYSQSTEIYALLKTLETGIKEAVES